jgi:hypothetical protein
MLAIAQLLLLLRAPSRVPRSQACTHTAPGIKGGNTWWGLLGTHEPYNLPA